MAEQNRTTSEAPATQAASATPAGQAASASAAEPSAPESAGESSASSTAASPAPAPVSAAAPAPAAERVRPNELAALLPFPAADANKFTRGKLVLVAGSDRYPGAACLAAAASQRVGAGYTEVVTVESALTLVRGFRPSLVVVPRERWNASECAVVRAGHPCAIGIGPGFDTADPESFDLVETVLDQVSCPVLIDGGAIGAVASAEGIGLLRARGKRQFATVLTPHGGEAARLAHGLADCDEASAAALARVREGGPDVFAATLARLLRSIVVLKGPDTYVSDGPGTVAVTSGTPALAKAGTGDVLAGMIAGLLAQGLEPFDACVLGVELHARAGRAAARRFTDIGVVAEDVVAAIPSAVRELAACKG